jgi:hypothetical protein
MEVEMLGREAVDVVQCHEFGEERIPPCRKVHAEPEIVLGFGVQTPVQRPDDHVEHPAHPLVVEDFRACARTPGAQRVGPRDRPGRGRRPGRARLTRQKRSPAKLLELARGEDAAHRAAHQKPIPAGTLRARLGIGAAQARRLVKAVRSEFQAGAEGSQQLAAIPRGACLADVPNPAKR